MNIRKLVLLTSVCSGLEYYDFVMYGLLSTYLGRVFFPSNQHWTGLVQALGLFAIGYVIRPIGGLLFGHIGDRYGRKKSLLISIGLMAVATTSIGLLPGFNQIGGLATGLLILLRLLQGLAFGAEIPGMLTFITEHAPQNSKGFYFGFVLSAVTVGGALGSLLPYLLTTFLTEPQLLTFGWRIPFCIGGVWSMLVLLVRNRMTETPLFIAQTQMPAEWPVLLLLRHHRPAMLLGISVCLFPACLIVLGVGLPAILAQFYGYSASMIFSAVSIGAVLSIFMMPLFGRIADVWGSTTLLMGTAILFIVFGWGLFSLLNDAFLGLFFILYNLLVAALANAYLHTLVSLFPQAVRFSGVGFCYNMVFSMAGFVPFLLSLAKRGEPMTAYLYCFFSVLALASILGCLRVKKLTIGIKA